MLLTVLLGIGVCSGVVIYRSIAWLRMEMSKPSFISSGFEYARCGLFEGWLSRDPNNNDWIIWDTKTNHAYRGPTSDALLWVPSYESEHECMKLGAIYASRQPRKTRQVRISRKMI